MLWFRIINSILRSSSQVNCYLYAWITSATFLDDVISHRFDIRTESKYIFLRGRIAINGPQKRSYSARMWKLISHCHCLLLLRLREIPQLVCDLIEVASITFAQEKARIPGNDRGVESYSWERSLAHLQNCILFLSLSRCPSKQCQYEKKAYSCLQIPTWRFPTQNTTKTSARKRSPRASEGRI